MALMICGETVWLPAAGQYRTCTNHDMPGPGGVVRNPHRSGPWNWAHVYPMIGPEEPVEYDWGNEE